MGGTKVNVKTKISLCETCEAKNRREDADGSFAVPVAKAFLISTTSSSSSLLLKLSPMVYNYCVCCRVSEWWMSSGMATNPTLDGDTDLPTDHTPRNVVTARRSSTHLNAWFKGPTDLWYFTRYWKATLRIFDSNKELLGKLILVR